MKTRKFENDDLVRVNLGYWGVHNALVRYNPHAHQEPFAQLHWALEAANKERERLENELHSANEVIRSVSISKNAESARLRAALEEIKGMKFTADGAGAAIRDARVIASDALEGKA